MFQSKLLKDNNYLDQLNEYTILNKLPLFTHQLLEKDLLFQAKFLKTPNKTRYLIIMFYIYSLGKIVTIMTDIFI